MPQIGSYSLLLGARFERLHLCRRTSLAIRRSDDRLAETARRAGVALFYCGYRRGCGAGGFGVPRRLLARLHSASQQPRSSRAVQVRRALVGAGRLAAVLVLAAGRLRAGAAAAPQGGHPPGGARVGGHQRGSDLLPAAGELRRPPLRAGERHNSRRTATGSIRCCSIRRW